MKDQILEGAVNPGFIADAMNRLLSGVYYTPKKVSDFIDSEKIKSIIGNPPFNKK